MYFIDMKTFNNMLTLVAHYDLFSCFLYPDNTSTVFLHLAHSRAAVYTIMTAMNWALYQQKW